MKKLAVALAVIAFVSAACSSEGTKKSEGVVDPAPMDSSAPSSTTSTTAVPTSTSVEPTTTTTARATTTTSAPASSTYYANCAAAKAAGAAPLYRGQPGYRDGLDRDRDGVACET